MSIEINQMTEKYKDISKKWEDMCSMLETIFDILILKA